MLEETLHAAWRQDPDRSARGAGRHHRLHGAGRKLPRRARRPARLQPHQDHHLPPGGWRLDDGGGLGQDHRRARHLLRHARARRRQRHERAARRAAGLDAHADLRRHALERARGPRGLPGDRDQAALRLLREVGGRHPPDRAHPRVREPRLPRRPLRPPRPRRAGPAGGHAGGRVRSPGRQARPHRRGAPGGRRSRAAAGEARRRQAAAHDRRRARMEHGRARRPWKPSPTASTWP